MNWQDLPQKKWFSWIIIVLLLVVNVISYNMASEYFDNVSPSSLEEVKQGNDYLGSGNKVVDWAKDILRFFKNP